MPPSNHLLGAPKCPQLVLCGPTQTVGDLCSPQSGPVVATQAELGERFPSPAWIPKRVPCAVFGERFPSPAWIPKGVLRSSRTPGGFDSRGSPGGPAASSRLGEKSPCSGSDRPWEPLFPFRSFRSTRLTDGPEASFQLGAKANCSGSDRPWEPQVPFRSFCSGIDNRPRAADSQKDG
jgi:hypothetical protein